VELEGHLELRLERVVCGQETAAAGCGRKRPGSFAQARRPLQVVERSQRVRLPAAANEGLDEVGLPLDDARLAQAALRHLAFEQLEVDGRLVRPAEPELEQAERGERERDNRPEPLVTDRLGAPRVRDAFLGPSLRSVEAAETAQRERERRRLLGLVGDSNRLGGADAPGHPAAGPEVDIGQACERIRKGGERARCAGAVDRRRQDLARVVVSLEPGEHLAVRPQRTRRQRRRGRVLGEKRYRALLLAAEDERDPERGAGEYLSIATGAPSDRARPLGKAAPGVDVARHEGRPRRVRQHARCAGRVELLDGYGLVGEQRPRGGRSRVPHVDRAAQVLDARACRLVRRLGQSVLEQLAGPLDPAGEPHLLCGGTQSTRAIRTCGAQPSGALECSRRLGMTAA
jgi:hypothetical protein